MNYYNEFDPKAAAWLRELIKGGHIANGVVDERSITDVQPDELREYSQCHFFAGIGGWSYALRLAGWPDDRPVWTGSCPCQPFSTAGKQMGRADPRHLWPAFRRLINKCGPPVVFGEQVASAAGREWLAGVRSNLETMGYAVGASDLCAAGVGAPHIRQRLYWLADAEGQGRSRVVAQRKEGVGERARAGGDCATGRLVDAALPQETRLGSLGIDLYGQTAWCASSTMLCADGKTRRFEPSAFPLAHGVSGRVGLLRGYGNSICPQIAQIFIESYLDVLR